MKKLNLFAIMLMSCALLAGCDESGGSMHEGSKTENEDMASSKSNEKMNMEEMKYMVDANNSKIQWHGSMIGLFTQSGVIPVKEGAIKAKGNKITDGQIVIDMTKIQPQSGQFNAEEGHSKSKLAQHLSSDAFFAVEKYPTARFEITGTSNDGTKLKGKLTIRGKTNPAMVNNVRFDPQGAKAEGTLTFDRKEYDAAFTMGAKDKVIADDIDLDIMLTFKKPEA